MSPSSMFKPHQSPPPCLLGPAHHLLPPVPHGCPLSPQGAPAKVRMLTHNANMLTVAARAGLFIPPPNIYMINNPGMYALI